MIICEDISSKGSGFVVGPRGHVVTNNHVVAQQRIEDGAITVTYSDQIIVVINGQRHPARVVVDQSDFRPIVYDYAVLLPDELPAEASHALRLGNPDSVRQGDEVLCLGYPLDFTDVVATNGIISAVTVGPSHVNALHNLRSIVSNALIQFGSSGGPMIHVPSGTVIGINTHKYQLHDLLSQRLMTAYSHPGAVGFPLLRDLIEYSVKYTYIGLNHAVSIEYIHGDPLFEQILGELA